MMEQRIDYLVVFLILHFNEMELTNNAIESLLKLNRIQECKIVVVDNASPNLSGESLIQKYKKNWLVDVIINKTNEGFSGGHNYGYRYIKSCYNAEFIIAMNNDVLIEQIDFIDILIESYRSELFHVAGPDVYVPKIALHANPSDCNVFDNEGVEIEKIKRIRKDIRDYKKLFSVKSYLKYRAEKSSKDFISRCFYTIVRKTIRVKKWEERKNNVILNGCFLIFDHRFTVCREMLFSPVTFMYGEEDILSLECVLNGWDISYRPELHVIHLEKGSHKLNKMSYTDYKRRQVSIFESYIVGHEKCIEYMKSLELDKVK